MTQPEIWTTLKVLDWTKEYLAAKGIKNSRLEAEWMLCEATGLDRVGLYLSFEKPLNEDELTAYRAMVTRRARHEPLQYILGSQEFCGLEFEVTPEVLIPRYDTETLVMEAVARMPASRNILDIGVGSGCIAVALAKQLPNAMVTGTDISEPALAIARRNALKNGVDIEFLSGSMLGPVGGRRFDLIVSNPPYIPTADIGGLQPEVRDFEPRGALDGGPDGLDAYRMLVPVVPDYLNPGGWLLVEIGIGQAGSVMELFKANGFTELFTARDPAGIERVVGGSIHG
ncbi:MAG: peptide chain release factor N(5)-glutamine methyltransferase [Geobacter sp.]|nr:MAG: peptide chain release factor N(5)-glutamine methyltransferase [Geobacter sp.]